MYTDIILISLLVVCVVLSAFFSGSEIIYSHVNKLKLKRMADEGNKNALAAYELANNFPTLISTILIGNNLVNIAASNIAGLLFEELFETNGSFYAGLIITGIILIFGEILPKTILQLFPIKLSIAFQRLIRFFRMIFSPLVKLMTYLIGKLSKYWTPKEDDEEDTSDGEILNMVEQINEDGYIDQDTKEIVASTLELSETTAEEIMTPRVDIFACDINDKITNIIKEEELCTYSRIVFYEETIDNIVGVISSRKLIIDYINKKEIDLQSMLSKPILVHKTKSLISILKVFKKTKTHIAIVVDEFGGTLGIITLEDVLEELVGDIWDEMDIVEEEFEKEDETTFLVDGDMNLDDCFELIGYNNEEYECAYSTVAGWCTEILDDFPKENDTFKFENYNVKIIQVEGVRVEKVEIEVLTEEE